MALRVFRGLLMFASVLLLAYEANGRSHFDLYKQVQENQNKDSGNSDFTPITSNPSSAITDGSATKNSGEVYILASFDPEINPNAPSTSSAIKRGSAVSESDEFLIYKPLGPEITADAALTPATGDTGEINGQYNNADNELGLSNEKPNNHKRVAFISIPNTAALKNNRWPYYYYNN